MQEAGFGFSISGKKIFTQRPTQRQNVRGGPGNAPGASRTTRPGPGGLSPSAQSRVPGSSAVRPSLGDVPPGHSSAPARLLGHGAPLGAFRPIPPKGKPAVSLSNPARIQVVPKGNGEMTGVPEPRPSNPPAVEVEEKPGSPKDSLEGMEDDRSEGSSEGGPSSIASGINPSDSSEEFAPSPAIGNTPGTPGESVLSARSSASPPSVSPPGTPGESVLSDRSIPSLGSGNTPGTPGSVVSEGGSVSSGSLESSGRAPVRVRPRLPIRSVF